MHSSLPKFVTGFAEVNGTTLYYETQGEGYPLILLQGGNLDLRMWDVQFAEFSKDYQVVRYDVRGFGRSGVWGTPYQAHEDLSALLDALAIEQAHLIGLSLGGRISVDFAIKYPDRVSSLVLAGPGLSGFNWSNTGMEWLGPIQEAIRNGDSKQAAALWLDGPYMTPAMEQEALAARLRFLAAENSRVWTNTDPKELPLSPPAAQRLDELHAPMLLLIGSRDVPDIHRIVELLLTAASPNIKRVTFEGAGHMINVEQPEKFNQVVLEFLKDL